MKRASWLNGLRTAIGIRPHRLSRSTKRSAFAPTRRRIAAFELLEDRRLLALDYGDTPDTGLGTGAANYNTLSTDNGPNHTIVAGIRMGATVDGDGGALQNAQANADDVNGALPDDEDGLLNPGADLVLTIGAQPTLNLRVTNTTGAAATLYGWIDYNGNGAFDNATERATVAVPNGTNNLIKTLTLPAVPTGFTGTTYARFRLSTDGTAANSTGAASDGEVEDYRVSITAPSSGLADSAKTKKIASGANNGPTLANSDYFGRSVAAISDIDGDGVVDLAVGANGDDTGGTTRGAVHVLLMNDDGTVKIRQKITGSGIGLSNGDYFGSSLASLGDVDGDGVTDIAVGAERADIGGISGSNVGVVFVLFLNPNGTRKGDQLIYNFSLPGSPLTDGDYFGRSVAALGDLDGDGVTDLAVGAYGDDTGGANRGAVYVLMMNANGSVKSSQKIASGLGGGLTLANSDKFGSSVTSMGDLDGDGVRDLAVGAIYDDAGGSNRGAVHVLFMNSNGTVKSSQKIASGIGGGPTLVNGDQFGASLAALGDLDGDGVTDLAVGANYDDTGGTSRGAIHVMFMNANGTVKASHKIANGTNGGPTLANDDRFGVSVTSMGDLDGDGLTDLAVGANFDDTGGTNRGAVYTLFLNAAATNANPVITSPNTANVPENTTSVMTVTATDSDLPPQTITFSIVGGADQSKFSITAGGALSFASPPNFEAPTDANSDNVYIVTVQASDGSGGTAMQTINVTVAPVNESSPVFTSPTAFSVVSHTTVATLTATDADLPAQTITYSVVGGADQARFFITNGGELGFTNPPNIDIPADSNGDNVYIVTVQASDGAGGTAMQTINVTIISLTDYGDAPDATGGTGPGNYNTRLLDGGASHSIVAGLRMGMAIDGNGGILQNAAANTDDVNGALSDDEDGISNPAADLLLTVGAQPMVNVRVTNTTGAAATLYGWIDYNANGVFDNATERASVAVPAGTNNGIVTLTFPLVTGAHLGTTYARFRLGTSPNAASPTGAAGDGEVEDYRASILKPSSGIAEPTKTRKIANGLNGLPAGALANGDKFGSAITAIGDLDGDGVGDVAVGATGEYGGLTGGTLHVLFMNANGTVKARQAITSGVGGGPILANGDYFGHSVTSLGDLDGDGITDLAVGADRDDTGGNSAGSVYVLFMNANGTVKSSQKIANGIGGGPVLAANSDFGSAVTSLGDLDGDGVTDLAVGSVGDDTGGPNRGALHVLFLNPNGTVKASQKIASGIGGAPVLLDRDYFGLGVASLGDLDGDGISDLAASAFRDDTGGNGRGAVHVLLMNANGTVKSSQKIASGGANGPVLANQDYFGRSLTSLGDLDGDGVTDLAVGAYQDDTGGTGRGAVHVLLLNSSGTVKASHKVASGTGGGPTLANYDNFSSGVAAVGDLDGDGLTELAVGAERDDTGGSSRGAAYVLFLKPINRNPIFSSPNSTSVPENSTAVMTVTATDPDLPPQAITFSIVGGADQARFGITPAGALSFLAPPNFEAATDTGGDNVYVVTVQASDGAGGTATQTINVSVTPVNEFSPVFTSSDSASVPENTTAVKTVTASDADLPAQLVGYSIVGGADQSKFTITTGGILSFISAPNFEAPTDANGDNVYVVVVQASDGSLTTPQAVLVTVTPVNDNNPVFTSTNTASVPENTTAVKTVTASDADLPAQNVTFSIVGGADQAKFGITAGGALSFLAAPNFEAPTDFGADNIYVITVQASDGAGGTTTQSISVTVTPVNDNNPVITSADTVNVAENSTAVLTVTATDADLPPQSITFSIVGGADQARFAITPGGVLSFNSPPDFEAPADSNGDNVYVVIVQASDGSLAGLQALVVTVTDAFEGDYNLDNSVDMADYVVWRNTLGTNVPPFSGADGSGNGIIDQADRTVCMANFGRTQPAAGTAGTSLTAMADAASTDAVGSTPADLAEPIAAAALLTIEPVADELGPVAKPAMLVARPPLFRVGPLLPSVRPTHGTRPVGPILPAAAAISDDALVAWLSSAPQASRQEADAESKGDYEGDSGHRDSPDQIVDVLDLVFASLDV